MKKKVLYLHGLNSKLHDDRRLVLEKYDLIIEAPQVDYENNPYALKEIMHEFDADFIIGSSTGGLGAYYISGLMNVPALLFNPAIPFRHEMEEIPHLPPRKKFLQVVLGAKDEVVSAKETLEFLENQIDTSIPLHIHWLNDLAHAIPIEIFESEVDFFLKHF